MAQDDQWVLMHIPSEEDIERLERRRERLETKIGELQDILRRIEADRVRRPDVYRRGASGGSRREELMAEMQAAMEEIKMMVEQFKKKFAVYLMVRDALPAVCSVGAVGACVYTGNVVTALKIIGGVFTVVTGLVLSSVMDTSIPLSPENRLWFTDFFSFFVISVRPKLD
jgi:hypothetical protein